MAGDLTIYGVRDICKKNKLIAKTAERGIKQ